MEHLLQQVITTLQSLGSEEHRASKARLGIPHESALGVSLPDIRNLAKQFKRNQSLALELWQSGYHEARLLAVLVADPKQTEVALVERWLGDVVSWDLCDHLCNNLACKVPACLERIPAWAADEREFVRRAAFALIVSAIIHQGLDKKLGDDELLDRYFGLMRRYASDDRMYVKKAISWALREIGKRGDHLQEEALQVARDLSESSNKAERWVGNDAIKELETLVNIPGFRRKAPAGSKRGKALAEG